MARKSVRQRRAIRRRRILSLLNDGFTTSEAEFYTGLNWSITQLPLSRMRRIRRKEIADLRRRRWSNTRIRRFYSEQWALTNEADLAAQLIDEKYQQVNKRRLRRAA